MPVSTRGPYAKTADVRRRVIDACMAEFGQSGFYGATMKDIAKRAGTSYTGLLHHFPSKESLLVALLETRAGQSFALLESADGRSPRTQPLDALRGMLSVLRDNESQPGLVELHCVLSAEATAAAHPAHDYYADRFHKLRVFYADAYRALREQGLLRSDLDAESLATMTIGVINGVQTQWLFDRGAVRVATTVEEFLTALVPALR